jgi:hypothetical protein
MKKQTFKTIENLFNQTSQRVNDAFPSIFSKEDVNHLLYQFYQQLETALSNEVVDEPKQSADGIKSTIESIKKLQTLLNDAIEQTNFDDDILDKSGAEFSIRHGNEIEIDYISIDEGQIHDTVQQSISDTIDEFVSELENATTTEDDGECGILTIPE